MFTDECEADVGGDQDQGSVGRTSDGSFLCLAFDGVAANAATAHDSSCIGSTFGAIARDAEIPDIDWPPDAPLSCGQGHGRGTPESGKWALDVMGQ